MFSYEHVVNGYVWVVIDFKTAGEQMWEGACPR